jgi:O-antigen ligase
MFIGKGLGYDEYYMRKNFLLLSKLGHEGGVHNTYLILWVNTGVVGLLAFFSAVFSFIIQGYKKNKFAFASLVAILISINYEPWLSGSLNPYSSIFIILLVIFVYVKDDEEYEIV